LWNFAPAALTALVAIAGWAVLYVQQEAQFYRKAHYDAWLRVSASLDRLVEWLHDYEINAMVTLNAGISVENARKLADEYADDSRRTAWRPDALAFNTFSKSVKIDEGKIYIDSNLPVIMLSAAVKEVSQPPYDKAKWRKAVEDARKEMKATGNSISQMQVETRARVDSEIFGRAKRFISLRQPSSLALPERKGAPDGKES
jgi:phosphodiesterase/alkaline phosphatase D-like protein